MSFFDRLIGSSSSAPAAPAPAPTPEVPAAASPVLDPAALSSQGAATPTPTPQPDAFADFWNTTGADGEQLQTPSLGAGINFNLDMQALSNAANQLNFAGQISESTMQSIAAGGPDAVKAMQDALNQVGRQAFLTNAKSTTSLVQAAVQQSNNNIAGIVQEQLRLAGLDNVQKANPVLSNPTYAPIVDSVKTQLVRKFPTASQEDLNSMLGQYFDKMATSMGYTPSAAPAKSQVNQDIDWAQYLS
jgi:hypothetical protein